MQRKRIFCLVAVGFLAAGAVGVSAQPASAAWRTYASTVVAQTARTAAVPAFACGWTPRKQLERAGGIQRRRGQHPYRRQHQLRHPRRRLHRSECHRALRRTRGPDNHFWFYLTDQTTGITGWVRNDLVGFPSMPVGITDY